MSVSVRNESVGLTDDDEAAIILAVANRTRVADIARAYRTTISDINAVVERRASEMFSGEAMRRKMFIEDARLEALGEFHYQRGKEGDVQSGALYVKISERRATLSGMNAPSGHIVQLVGAANAPKAQTSTEQISSLLDNILRITLRERELLNQESDAGGWVSPEVRAEINALRETRGKPPLPMSPEVPVALGER